MTELLRQDAKTGRFVQGNSGNPAGRPIGSRNKLSEAFLADFYADWKKHGVAAVREMRETDIVAYVKIAALLVAKSDTDGTQATGVTVVNVITGVPG